jgi:hypothetical protein
LTQPNFTKSAFKLKIVFIYKLIFKISHVQCRTLNTFLCLTLLNLECEYKWLVWQRKPDNKWPNKTLKGGVRLIF